MTRILFVGGATETVSAMNDAIRLGYNIAVVDGDEGAPGIIWAKQNSHPWFIASTYNAPAIIKALPDIDIGCVVAVGCDVAPVVSMVAEHLDLYHIPLETTLLSWDKHNLKRILKEGGLNVPLAPTEYDRQEGEPLIVKPSGGRGGRGVQYVETEDWNENLNLAAIYSPSNEAIAEQFLDGFQISTESIIYDGHIFFTGLTDRAYDIQRTKPNVVEFGGIGPSLFDYTLIGRKIRNALQEAVKILGISHGTIKGDIVVTPVDFKPYIIEMAIGRLSGGFNCTHYLSQAYGVDFMGAALTTYQGIPPHLYLIQTSKPCHVAGGYTGALTATHGKERGDFEMATGASRDEALNNLKTKGVDIAKMLPSNPQIFEGKVL